MADEQDELQTYLTGGWEVAGYSVCMMAAGATSHHILLRKDNELAVCGIINPGPKEIGRGVNVISPRASVQKRGFFG